MQALRKIRADVQASAQIAQLYQDLSLFSLFLYRIISVFISLITEQKLSETTLHFDEELKEVPQESAANCPQGENLRV
jgi:hypothetical protein